MASPGFMQNGASRELLERWAPDRRNGLLVTGYSIEGTMARVSRVVTFFFPFSHVGLVLNRLYLSLLGFRTC